MDGRLYYIYDREAKQIGPVFQAANDAVARRQYRKLIRDVDVSESDFDLVYVGSVVLGMVIPADSRLKISMDPEVNLEPFNE